MTDVISRSELLAFIKEKYHDIVAGGYPYNIVAYDLVRIIENAPDFQMERAQWIEASPGKRVGMKCSKCKARIRYSEYNSGNHNYCHKCGRLMEGAGR